MNNRILVTGGLGYIGSVICDKLIDRGYSIRVLDNNLFNRKLDSNLDIVYGDIRDHNILRKSLSDIDSVIHLAANVGDVACNIDKYATVDINFRANKSLFNICKEFGINNVMFISTCNVYGLNREDIILDETNVPHPVSLYGITKLLSEEYIIENKLPFTILRLPTIYGLSPRMRFDLIINRLISNLYFNKSFTIYDGTQWRPIINVKDVANILIKCLETNRVRGKILNVGHNSYNHQLGELKDIASDLVPDSEIKIDKTKTDVASYHVDFSKLQNLIKYEPHISLKQYMIEIIDELATGKYNDFTNIKYYNDLYLRANKEKLQWNI